MASRFLDRVVLITGASSGIGAETARAFAREGARLFLVARRQEEGEAVAEEIRGEGGEARFFRADLALRGEIQSMVRACLDAYGSLHIAFNNAGVEGPFGLDTADYPESSWDELLAVNLTGVWLSMRAELPALLRSGGGAIVNMASIAGLKGVPGASAYVGSKFGVIGITRAAALEYAQRGIRINAVCPGAIRTALADRALLRTPAMEAMLVESYPMGRVGTMEEVAGAVLWLCSEEASFVTGASLPIDGGKLS